MKGREILSVNGYNIFMKNVYYRAKHILLEDQEDAEEIRQMIVDGLSFEDAAKEYSECDSREKGGNLGKFASGTMVPEFERALYHLKLGELSQPIETQFGFHLILRVE